MVFSAVNGNAKMGYSLFILNFLKICFQNLAKYLNGYINIIWTTDCELCLVVSQFQIHL